MLFKKYIEKKKKENKERKERKKYLKERNTILKHGVHSELMVERPDGKDRCSLILSSYDTPQLKELQRKLKERGIGSELLEGFRGGKTSFKFNLTPRESTYGDIATDFLDKMEFLERYFVYGKPVKDIGFFEEDELELISKWYKK